MRLINIKNTSVFACLLLISHLSFASSESEVVANYADIALASYNDSLIEAQRLLTSVEELAESPSEKSLLKAKNAWIKARVPYQQSEVFRFGNSIVDDWEGRVNAWPLDEGLIDYVDNSYGDASEDNPLRSSNVIANSSIKFSGKTIDVSTISKSLLADGLHEADGVEANVATGYHAIEFLLWGQDLNGTKAGAGDRPATDFDLENCSNKNCDRRVQYLLVATQLLIDDLEWMLTQWQLGGAAREALYVDEKQAINSMITGLGSLSYGELAGERIKLGLILHDPEEEHDCFSDNTHDSHFYNVKGIENVYLGQYKSVDGTVLKGASLSSLVSKKDAGLDKILKANLNNSLNAAQGLVDSAEAGIAYDQLIGEGNVKGNAKVSALVDALLEQTKSIKALSSLLGSSYIEFEGSDSLDSPDAVFQ